MKINIESTLTITFDDPFWIAVYERTYADKYEVCKITFGSEPKDCEVYEYMLNNWNHMDFTKPIKKDDTKKHHINPKRLQREINKRLQFSGVGTKAQQALKLQHELVKGERKNRKKEDKKLELENRYNLKQQKKKEKHKGR